MVAIDNTRALVTVTNGSDVNMTYLDEHAGAHGGRLPAR